MKIRVLDQVEDDLIDGYNFYENQSQGVDAYFNNSLYSDIESLIFYAEIHRARHKGYRRLQSITSSVCYILLNIKRNEYPDSKINKSWKRPTA